jgi:hypothetical protein
MDLAYLILDLARSQHKKEINEASAIIEVIHSVFDHHSCAQWIRIYRCMRNGDCIVVHKGIPMRFPTVRDLLYGEGLELILQVMLHDFMEIAGTNAMTDMDYITFNVHHRGQRLSIQHNYIRGTIAQDDICETDCHKRDNHLNKIYRSFKKQVEFGVKVLGVQLENC